jgi:GT2 family glycosyltransferase
VPDGATPRVSIVIPTLGNPLILKCFDSLWRHIDPALSYEVVVVANAAPPAALQAISAVARPALRLITASVNLGFAGGCNLGAAEAGGEFLVFLNDDTEVLPGWLEALVETAEAFTDVGAVGSVILFPDGTLQEAGCMVWRDGSTLGVGRGLPLETSPYDFLRPVDYCSACSLLVRRTAWEEVGGFDTRYFPAYYEDVDLCLSLARAGARTVLQPRSRIVHHETASSTTLRRNYLTLRNRDEFRAKWADVLEHREAPAPLDPLVVSRTVEEARGSHHLLIIDDRPPQRGCGSGFGVLLDAIADIRDTGYAVTVAVSDRMDGDMEPLARMGVHVLRERPERALAAWAGLYDCVLIARPHNFARYAPLVRQHQSQASLVYLAEALFYRRMQRSLELLTDPSARAALAAEMMEFRDLERSIPVQADAVVCVSDEEAALLSTIEGHCPIERIRPIEAGVTPSLAGFASRDGLLFVPGWLAGDASPNVDALQWFVTAVLPYLLAVRPDIRLRVTGGHPPEAVRALAGPSVELMGFVPDLRAAYESARVVVVPMRIGAGVKVKCLEAVQHGVPVVSTTVGAEGLGLSDTRAVRVTDDPGLFAATILDLYESQDAWERQRSHVVRTAAQWAEQSERTWRHVLVSPLGVPRHGPQYVSA